jgi:hypothetical protein
MELRSIILCISAIDQELVQEVRCPTEHYSLCATALNPAGDSSFLHFLNSLQAMSLMENPVASLLIYLSIIPLFPQLVPNYVLTSSTISFSRTLLSKYSSGCGPIMGNPLILAINATSSCTGLSIQRMSSCT